MKEHARVLSVLGRLDCCNSAMTDVRETMSAPGALGHPRVFGREWAIVPGLLVRRSRRELGCPLRIDVGGVKHHLTFIFSKVRASSERRLLQTVVGTTSNQLQGIS